MSYSDDLSLGDLTPLQLRRLSWSVAKGVPVSRAVRRAGLKGPAAKDLLANSAFAVLIEAYQSLAELSEDEQFRHLVKLAAHVLQDALITGDRRVALFIMKHATRERHPAEVIARSVIKSLERKSSEQRKPPKAPDPEPAQAAPTLPLSEMSCPIDNAVAKAGSDLRRAVMQEHEVYHAVHRAKPAKRPEGLPSAEHLSPEQRLFLLNRAFRQKQFGTPATTPKDHPSHPNGP